jgi:hypothetical protein
MAQGVGPELKLQYRQKNQKCSFTFTLFNSNTILITKLTQHLSGTYNM